MGLEIRAITDDEVTTFRPAAISVFGMDPEAEAGVNGADLHRALIGPGQAWGAFDAGTVVGTAATFDLSIGVPGGGSLPMAGLTLVTVRPTHRRRGILRELVKRHLDDARERDFAVSGLWASDAPIYGRFGYGVAAFCDVVEIANAGSLKLAPRELDRLDTIEEAQARALLPAVYARATAGRPGALRRSDVWWRERRFLETPMARAGASKRRHVIARRGDEIVGYIVYRQRPKFTDGLPDGRLEVNELLAVDPRAEASLWAFALSVDLFPTVSWWNAPPDSALPWLVDDMRRVKTRRADSLWLRLEDVAAALSARGYASDGALRLAVDGTTYELVAEAGRAECRRSTAKPDVDLDSQTLASLFLGGASATQLARAERIRGESSSIATADRLFASSVAPWCPEVF